MGLLDGLDSLGLSGIENISLYEDEKKNTANEDAKEKAAPVKEVKETDFLYDKTFECPVCGNKFKQRVVRSNSVKMIAQDKDLRPIYEHVDLNKYEVVLCERCGYASLIRFHAALPKPFRDLIRQNISARFSPPAPLGETISYEQAMVRYKMALLNAVVRKGKSSEKAFICLKMAWLYRSMNDAIEKDPRIPAELKAKKREAYKVQEIEYLKNAREGFIKARTAENTPYAGMNEVTLDYLIGVLSIETGVGEKDALRLLQTVAVSVNATKIQKERSVELIQVLKNKLKEE